MSDVRRLPPARRLWERVEQARTARGWTSVRLSEESGVDRATVSRWRTGRRNPLPEKVIAVADALGLPRAELLTLAGLAAPPESPVEQAIREVVVEVGDDETEELLSRLPERRRRVLEEFRQSERERLEREAEEATKRFARLVQSETSHDGTNGES